MAALPDNNLSAAGPGVAQLLARRLARRLVEVPKWTLDAEPQNPDDPDAPMYEVDEAGHHVRLFWHWGQMQAWDSLKRIIFVLSGTQGGKTSFLPWWVFREIVHTGGGDHLVVTVSYDLFKLKLLPEIREVFEHVLGVGRYWAGDQVLEIKDPLTGQFHAQRADDKMWGRIILRSAAAKGGLESATAKSAALDEAGQDDFKVSAWEAIQRRVALNQGRTLVTTTPYNLGWMKQRLHDPVQRANGKHPEIDLINFPSTANPKFSETEMRRARETMPTWKYLMFYEGKFTRPAGLIYTDFVNELREADGHLVKPFNLPKEWPRIAGVDPGIIHQAEVWGAVDVENETLYLYRSMIQARKPQEQHARDAMKRAKDGSERVIKWAIGAKSEIYHREDWKAAGAKNVVEPDTSDVEEGIDRVTLLFKQYRIYIFDDLYELIEELLTYSRETDEDGEPTDKIRDKSTFHRLDALRYLVVAYVKKQPNWNLKAKVKKYV
ncbi:terminase [Phototrophicus methaneseepsis]|uniref:Terminase n=1 Tax=Phototrophicus methaneseepsis TaxID=2710758 RepID=A0A7S8E617_9CHLR|nr:terminase [Phototrophicus methaneseepsis]QPC81048.1 terminase [Phototrophicus methaneseepsis]